jgi:hypothetical protein
MGVVWLPSFVLAQSLDVQHLEPNTEAAALSVVRSGAAMAAWQAGLGFELSYAPAQLVAKDEDGNILGDLVGDRLDLMVAGNLGLPVAWAKGLLAGIDAGVVVPVTLLERRDVEVRDGEVVRSERTTSGVGDLRLQLRLGLLSAARAGLDLAIVTGLRVPLAPQNSFFGSNSLVVTPELALGRRMGPVLLAVNLGYRLRHDEHVLEMESGDELVYRAGFGLDLGAGSRSPGLALAVELFGLTSITAPFSKREQSPSELLTSLRLRLGAVVLCAGAGVGLSSGYGVPDVRALFGVAFAPETQASAAVVAGGRGSSRRPFTGTAADRDRDGISDEADKCPDIPEDFDEFDDQDGCPDVDDDDDHVKDADDQCPDLPEDLDGDRDTDGCPDETPPQTR